MKKECQGCEAEMFECYRWQSRGYDAGLRWFKDTFRDEIHCGVFVLDKNGKRIVW